MAYVNQLVKCDPTRKNVFHACDDLTFKGIQGLVWMWHIANGHYLAKYCRGRIFLFIQCMLWRGRV